MCTMPATDATTGETWLTVGQAVTALEPLRVSRSFIREAALDGRLRAVRVGRDLRVANSSIRDALINGIPSAPADAGGTK